MVSGLVVTVSIARRNLEENCSMLAQAQMVLPENFYEEARSAAARSLLLSYSFHCKAKVRIDSYDINMSTILFFPESFL